MTIDPNVAVTLAEVTKDFPKIAKLAEEKGHVTVLQNGRPKLLVIDLDTKPQIEMSLKCQRMRSLSLWPQESYASTRRRLRSWRSDPFQISSFR